VRVAALVLPATLRDADVHRHGAIGPQPSARLEFT
jgi:hypothetical protein